MRQPELNEPQLTEEYPLVMRRMLFLAAIGSLVLAGISAWMTHHGYEVVQGLRQDPYERDKMLALIAGLPASVIGLIFAWQGWSGLPKVPSRILAGIGALLNLTILLGAGIPLVIDLLKTIKAI